MPKAEARVVAPFCPPVPQSEFIHDWIPLTSAEEMADNEYDVLIVGSGAGGGAALWRLCEQWGNNGKRIGMVERGPNFLPTHVANIATINDVKFRLYAPPQITDLIGNRLPQYSGLKLVYALGGRTLVMGSGLSPHPKLRNSKLAGFAPRNGALLQYRRRSHECDNTRIRKIRRLRRCCLNRLRANGYFNADDIPIAADLDQTRLRKTAF